MRTMKRWLAAIVLAAGAATAAQAAPMTVFYYTSSPSSWVGQGETVTVTPTDGFAFNVNRNFDNGVSFAINDFLTNPDFQKTRWWYLDFAAPFNALLTVGYYDHATRWPFQDAENPGLSFSGNGRGNNMLTGFFEVLEAVYDVDGTVLKFAADFTQFDEGFADWWNKGAIRFNSDVPLFSSVPEPATGIVLMIALALVAIAYRRTPGRRWNSHTQGLCAVRSQRRTSIQWMKRLLAAGALATSSISAQAAAIGFDDLTGGQNDPFYFYTEDGFMVFPAGGEPWVQNVVYGKPAPSVIFHRPREAPELFAGMFVRAEDLSDFTFSAVDLYSSVTPIPYRFIGYDENVPVFDVYGTMPNTFGQFMTALNPNGDVLIDLLYIELVNPFVALGGNPVGFDNVVVSLANQVPEPGSLTLALAAFASLAGVISPRRRTRGAPTTSGCATERQPLAQR